MPPAAPGTSSRDRPLAAGAVIEVLQGRYFNRGPEILDVAAELVGSVGRGATATRATDA